MNSLSKLQLSLAFADVILTGASPLEPERAARDQLIKDVDFLERGFPYQLSDGKSELTWHKEARRLKLIKAQPVVRRHFWEQVKLIASLEADMAEAAEVLEAARQAHKKQRIAEAVQRIHAAAGT